MTQFRFYVPDLHCGGCVQRFCKNMCDDLAEDEFQCDPVRRHIVFNLKKTKTVEWLKTKMRAAGFPAYLMVDSAVQHKKEFRGYLKRIFVAALGMMQVMMFSLAIYLEKDMPQSWKDVFHWFSFFVTTPVMLYTGKPFFYSAILALTQRRVNMEVPIALALGIAYTYSFLALMGSSQALYFDSINMFLFFITLGRFAQWQASFKSQEASEALWADIPTTVTRINNIDETIPIDEINLGDRIRISQGMQFAVDGIIREGDTLVDESMLTGESQPVRRGIGCPVYAGTINQTQTVSVEVTQIQGATQLGHIQRLLFEAQETKPNIARYTDRLAGFFVMGLLILSIIVGVIWWWIDPSQIVPILVSLLIVTCPCAFSLATPAAITATLARLTRSGVVVAKGDALERARAISHIMFDKTGTLTTGKFQITQVKVLDAKFEKSEVLALAAALEVQSQHPLARAFHAYKSPAYEASNTKIITSQGVVGHINGEDYSLGVPEILIEEFNLQIQDLTISQPIETLSQSDFSHQYQACTAILLVNKTHQQALALFWLQAETRNNIDSVMQQLKGYNIGLLSGDHEIMVSTLAKQLSITSWHSRATPEDKQRIIRDLQHEGHRVLMVGDGVNDGPVLSQADIGIAMGQGTALAKASADVILMHDSLAGLPFFFIMAQKCRSTIRQNIGWAILYNIIAIPFAACGLIPPWLAAIGMSVSSLLVVLNSLRLLSIAVPTAISISSIQNIKYT